ncbi:MAG TPA: hypothetical protein VJ455_09320, partial [Ignavibacteria bacterium]|nr:hypothetical protein [Ignavibacteria bacterium]
MARLTKTFKYLEPADIVTQAMFLILSLILLIFNIKVDYWYFFIPLNIILIYIIWKIVSVYEHKIETNNINEADEKS